MTRTVFAQVKAPFRSINTKLSLIMAGALFLCMVGLVGYFLVDNLKNSVQAEQQRLSSLGSIYRAVLSDPVSKSDITETREVLRSLRDIPTLKQAAVHGANGQLLGEMGGGAVLERTVMDSIQFDLINILTKETVRIESEIVLGGKTIGKLRLIADISWVIKQFWLQVTIALALSCVIVLVAWMFGTTLIRQASRQLSDLASGLADIGTTETLAYKFSRKSNDEVGILIDAFNDMMGRIHERDRALRSYNDNLEKTVAERTSELVIARDEAESANAAKSEFLAMMSHEIRTPMNGMMVMAQMLAAAPLSPRHLRFAEIINRSGQNLLSIINDVLDISKIEAGKLVIESSPFSIDDILADVHGLFYERAREKSLSISYTVNHKVPNVLIGDATRLNQVITNLVNNALKFTQEGGVLIEAATKVTENGLRLVIKITDTGIGIAKDKLDFVFERFAQADQSITRRFGGTGLGLAISRRLVEAMGGDISVSSDEGQGSTFEFEVALEAEQTSHMNQLLAPTKIKISLANEIERYALASSLQAFGATTSFDESVDGFDILLSDNTASVDRSPQTAMYLEPALDGAETGYRSRGRLIFPIPATREQIRKLSTCIAAQDFAAFRAGYRTQNQLMDAAAFRGLRALAVDDNTINREVLLEALTSMEIEADTAVNGADALEKAQAKNYDVIFMDCSMPVMDGYTATRILRDRENSSGHRVPIIAITALMESSGKDNWRNAGMDGWITKPFTIPGIAERISRLVLKQSEASDDTLISQLFSETPLLDEQTVSMIARLGSKGGNEATNKIHGLFVANFETTLQAMKQTYAENNNDLLVVQAHNLHSFAQSAGAARLARAAAFVEEQAKSALVIEPQILDIIESLFAESSDALSARYAIPPFARTGT